MPSWKKVITSGSNAAFNSLTVSSTITGSLSGSLTGSLQGTASWAEYVVNGSNTNTGSLLTTASVNLNTITFTKGNNTQFSITVNTGSGGTIDTSNLVTTSSFNAFTSSVNTFTASYNTGSFSGSFTGSFNGTASWATNAQTASYVLQAISASFASNGGVTQLLAGPNITLSPTNGLGQVTVTSTGGGGSSFNTATGSYGSFYDTTTQTNPVGNVPLSMSFNTTDISNGVSISGSTNPFNTYIKTQNAGIYNIQFSAQVEKTDSGTDVIVIWLRKNGIDLTDSATKLTLSGNGTKVVAAWNWFVSSAANDYYQIIWVSADTRMRLYAEPINDTPGIPSVILTVNRVDQFLSNTGSFSGSFTGSFNGTASWAQSASQALTASFVRNAQTASFLPTGTYQITSSWAINTLTASFAPNYLLTSSFELWTGSNSSQFDGTSSYTNFPRLGIRSGSITGIGDLVYHVPLYRNVVTGFTGSVYTAPFISSTGILAYSSSLDRLLTTASWAVNALTASYAENAPSALPGGNPEEIQFNDNGTFNGVPTLTYDGSTITATDITATGRFDGNLRLGLFRGTQTDIVVASDTDEVLIYTFPIPAGTFTDDDVIRVRWRTYNASKGSPEYYIYMADTSDFNTVSGSAANIIALCTASNNTISYLQMKRDFPLNSVNGRLEYITPSTPLITDDVSLINTTPIRTFAMDWNNTDYWMFFSAKPNDDTDLCVSKYCTVERI